MQQKLQRTISELVSEKHIRASILYYFGVKFYDYRSTTLREVCEKHGLSGQPIHFVFHGGSGSSREQIREAISYGVVKMNLDTDMQWAFWDGVHEYYKENKDYLQGQLGNPEGEEKPNKKNYDPRTWLRSAEKSFVARLVRSFEDLNCMNRNAG